MIHLGNLVTPFILWTILTTLRSARGVARQMKISSVRPEVQAHLKLYHSSNDYTSLNPRVLFTVEVVVCKSYVSDWKSLATFKSITPRLDSVVVGSMSRRCGTNDLIFVILNSSPGQFKLVFVADIMVCSPLQAFYDIRAAQWADHEWNAEWADNPTRLRTLIPDTGTHTPGKTLCWVCVAVSTWNIFPDFGYNQEMTLNDWEKESRRRTWSFVSFIVDKCELEEHRGN